MNILITGGLGFIGSHTVIKLIENGHNPIIFDNLCNTNIINKLKIEKITNKKFKFHKIDISKDIIFDIMKQYKNVKIDCIIHFAALKYINESISEPIKYYRNNVNGILNILDIMKIYNIKNLIFSSSATVYSTSNIDFPIKENSSTGMNITCPYGRTKYFTEEILKDFHKNETEKNIILLRYFNPVGAHTSGFIGELPQKYSENLFPCIQDAFLNNSVFKINGQNLLTKDGTPERDFIHVLDLAIGHISAYNYISNRSNIFEAINLGTGKPHSVLEIIKKMRDISRIDLKYTFGKHREGDLPISYADNTKAKNLLKWIPTKNINDICKDSWRWIKYGYKKNVGYSKIPLRVSLAGGGTDLPSYYKKYNGAVLGFPINKHIECFISETGDSTNIICDNQFYTDYIKKILIHKKIHNVYVKITIECHTPSGLGSSSALVLSVLDCIYQLKDIKVSLNDWAEESHYIEREILNIPGGKQENYICAYQEIGIYYFNKDDTFLFEKINVDCDFWKTFISNTELIYIEGNKEYNYLSDPNINYDNLHKQKQYVNLMRDAINEKDINKIKIIVKNAWETKKRLSTPISNDKIEKITTELEKKKKAYKMCGSGGAGYIFAIQ